MPPCSIVPRSPADMSSVEEALSQIARTATTLVTSETTQFQQQQQFEPAAPLTGGQPRRRLSTERTLVLGVVTNQRTPQTREWIRRTYMVDASSLDGVLLRFVIGRNGLNPGDR